MTPGPSKPPVENEEEYWQGYEEARQTLDAGRLRAAEEMFAGLLDATRQPRLRHLRDRAYCNFAGVGIACGSIVAEDDLAALLGASSDLKARQLAASHLGRLQSLKPWARAVSRTRAIRLYGGMAFRLARSLGDHHSEGVSLNLQGLGWLAESRWDEAIRCFEEATELLSGLPQDLAVPMIRSTLTYALSLAGDRREARRLLQHEHTPAGDLASSPPIHAAEIATNFAFACLETDDLELAITWGEAALAAAAVATTMGAGDPVDRYAHYAIGEAGARLGDRHRARWHFTAMQRKYYPALSELPDLLLAERTHRFVSWLA